jgi:hypothetical protein
VTLLQPGAHGRLSPDQRLRLRAMMAWRRGIEVVSMSQASDPSQSHGVLVFGGPWTAARQMGHIRPVSGAGSAFAVSQTCCSVPVRNDPRVSGGYGTRRPATPVDRRDLASVRGCHLDVSCMTVGVAPVHVEEAVGFAKAPGCGPRGVGAGPRVLRRQPGHGPAAVNAPVERHTSVTMVLRRLASAGARSELASGRRSSPAHPTARPLGPGHCQAADPPGVTRFERAP